MGSATADGALAGGAAASLIPIPGIATAAGAAIGAFVGGIIDLSSKISDALSSVADFLGLNQGPGSNRTALKEGLAPVLAEAIARAPAANYWPAVLGAASFLKQTILPAFDIVAHFSDDPTFVDDTMAEITAAAPPPFGAPPTVAAYFASLIQPHVTTPPASGVPKMVMAGPMAKPQPVLIFYRPPTAAQKAATTAANLTALDKAAGAATAARASAGIASSLGTPAKIAIGVVGTGVLGVWALLARRWLKGRR